MERNEKIALLNSAIAAIEHYTQKEAEHQRGIAETLKNDSQKNVQIKSAAMIEEEGRRISRGLYKIIEEI